ncbi:MAG: PGF-pre-PGF domain-containing protein [archaeon]
MKKDRLISLFLTVLVVASLFLATPSRAVTVSVNFADTSIDSGTDVAFTVSVDLNTNERIPVSSITVYINRGAGDSSVGDYNCTFDPLGTALTTCTGLTITSIHTPTNYGNSSLYGYGYGWFGGSVYDTNNSAYGYGYGYGYESAISSSTYPYGELAFNVTWSAPSVSTDTFYSVKVVAITPGALDGRLTYQTEESTTIKVNVNDDPSVSMTSPVEDAVYSDISTTPVPVTWTATAPSSGSISWQWYVLDNTTIVYFDNTVTTTNLSSSLSAGWHTIYVGANDTFGNAGSTTLVNFYVNAPVNMTQVKSLIESQTPVTNFTVFDSSGNDTSSNESTSINQTLSIQAVVPVTFRNQSVNATMTIPEFNGLDANWNNPFNMEIDISSTRANNINSKTGSSLMTLTLFTNMSRFLPNTAYRNKGARIFMNIPLPSGIQVLYIEDDFGDLAHNIQTTCATAAGPGTVTLSNMCYFNTIANITVWVPHLSGVGLANDTSAPTINITSPVPNGTIVNNSRFSLSFDTWETNPSSPFCHFNFTSGGTAQTGGYIDTTSMTQSGTKYSYSLLRTGITDGDYALKVWCSDLNGQNNSIWHNFTVNDTQAPTITSVSESQSGTTTRTVLFTVATDEAATCAYSTTDVAYASMTAMSGGSTTHTTEISFSSSVSSQAYYFRCEDTAGNTMTSSSGTSIDVTVTTTSSSGGGGFLASSRLPDNEYSRSFASVSAGTRYQVTPKKDQIPIESLKFSLKEDAANVEAIITAIDTVPVTVLDFDGTLYTYLSMQLFGVTNSMLDTVTARVNVPIDWFDQNGVAPEDAAVFRFTAGAWSKQPTTYAGSDSTHAYYDVIIEGFSFFAVGVSSQPAVPDAQPEPVIEQPSPDPTQPELEPEVKPTPEPVQPVRPETKSKDKKGSGFALTLIIVLIIIIIPIIFAFLRGGGKKGGDHHRRKHSLDRLEKKLQKIRDQE